MNSRKRRLSGAASAANKNDNSVKTRKKRKRAISSSHLEAGIVSDSLWAGTSSKSSSARVRASSGRSKVTISSLEGTQATDDDHSNSKIASFTSAAQVARSMADAFNELEGNKGMSREDSKILNKIRSGEFLDIAGKDAVLSAELRSDDEDEDNEEDDEDNEEDEHIEIEVNDGDELCLDNNEFEDEDGNAFMSSVPQDDEEMVSDGDVSFPSPPEDDEEIDSDVQCEDLAADEDDEDENHDGDEDEDEDETEIIDRVISDDGQFDDAIIVVDEMDPDNNPNHANESQFNKDSDQVTNISSSIANSSLASTLLPCERSVTLATAASIVPDMSVEDRKNAYLQAGMELLESQHIPFQHNILSDGYQSGKINNSKNSVVLKNLAQVISPILSNSAEQSLIKSLCDIVKPPKKETNFKIFMRRAPTQEEFFRGSLTKNPISLSSLRSNMPVSSTSPTSQSEREPLVKDLRDYLAKDLQMSDSAELLELLVANKILDMSLKLRVVSQVLWKKHVLENSTSTNTFSTSALLSGTLSGNNHHMISAGSGLSMIFNSALGGGGKPSGTPPMVVTYRLAGVDGEATEDKVEVNDLVDPEASGNETHSSPDLFEKKMEKEFGITWAITKGFGISLLLRSLETYIEEVVQKIHRDDIGRSSGVPRGKIKMNPSRELFSRTAPCGSLLLLCYCAKLKVNRKKMVDSHAPTILLRLLLDVLNCIDDSPIRNRADNNDQPNTVLHVTSEVDGMSATPRSQNGSILKYFESYHQKRDGYRLTSKQTRDELGQLKMH